MSKHQFDSEDTRRFTLTMFLSFAAIFVFLMLMMQCNGNYKTDGGVKNNSAQVYR